VYEPADGDLAFGDIFSAQWFFDAYLRRDAVPLVEFQMKGNARAWRRAAPSPQRDLAFAHGQPRSAILVADDCEIETILRRGGRSRLIFAAIEQLPPSHGAAQRELETRAFRRFPLPPAEGFAGGIVEFQQLFAMSVDGVLESGDGVDPRVIRLDQPARNQLEWRWNAFAVRRGPLTHLDNAEKLARLLTAGGEADKFTRLHARDEDPNPEHLEIARALVDTLNAAWDLEGAALSDVAEAYERRDDADASRATIIENLARLGARAQRARALLENLRDSSSS
jgi:hypothetical protein